MVRVLRKCVGEKHQGLTVKAGCKVVPGPMTMCYCSTDNCNSACTAESCPEGSWQLVKDQECKADCKSVTGGGGTGDDHTKHTKEPGHTGIGDHTGDPTEGEGGKTNGNEVSEKPGGENTRTPAGENTGKPDEENTVKPTDGSEQKPSGNDTSGKPEGDNDGKTTKSGSQRNWKSFQGFFTSLIIAAIVTLIKIF